ncbi:MAG: S-methyl-5-thioribose-1-phosphate isomerase, partial [Oscillospiraceae bacterium]|nr:S-methyl-5-thioribose-1-phosphate isomerase [Oscillospiraceae bacterium]
KEYLDSSRPTAVNLSWATTRMLKAYNDGKDLISEAIAIHNEDIAMCKKISEYGLSLLNNGDGILTHCNAGALATSEYGTGLGPLLLGKEKGYNFKVFCDETRPLLQGARLTAYELTKAGIDTTVICDNMASLVMKQGKINAVLVGTDRIAANGDIANKIGTSGVAILAKHYGIPFYVLVPYSTIDYNCPTGDDIVIEERDADEIKTMWYKKPMAPKEAKCYNPAFDVTDNSMITAIITDRGIVRAPYKENLERIKDND